MNRKLAVIYHRLGPYHCARLRAAARKFDLFAIEGSATDETYGWDRIDAAGSFHRITLFEDADIHRKRVGEVRIHLHRALESVAPDVVAIPGWSASYALLALSWCVRRGVPLVLMSDSTYDDAPRPGWREWVKGRLVGLCAAALVGGSRHVAYLKRLGMLPDRIFPGYDVVDNEYFAREADAARGRGEGLRARHSLPERYFLASNRFVEKKNLPRLLEAFARYRQSAGDDAWGLVLLGDGPLRGELERTIAERELGRGVVLPGFKQYDELPVYYGLAGAFVHASTTEQWGLVVNEAMAAGLPVIVSNRCGCAPDLVEEGRNGFSFDPYDVDDLAKKMVFVASAACDRGAMANISREIVRRWSPEMFAENLSLAVDVALRVQPCKTHWLDRGLPWILAHR